MYMFQAVGTDGVESESQRTVGYTTHSRHWGWSSFGALFGLVGGIVVACLGSAFTAISWITGVEGNGAYMHTLGTDFLFLTIPLIVLGALCLDVVETREKKGRKAELHGDK